MAAIKISREIIDKAIEIYADGDKVRAIKYIRTETGAGLREAKYGIEEGFSPAALDKYNFELTTPESIGGYIDRIFTLSAELAECYEEMRKLGWTGRK